MICFACAEPCTAPEINPAATTMPAPPPPFLGVLAPFADRIGFEQTDEEINKITLAFKL